MGPINHYEIPLLGRLSVMQLTLRPGMLGFSNLLYGVENWHSLGSPFLRLENEAAVTLDSEEEYVTQRCAAAELTALFCGPDALGIEIVCRHPLHAYSGAPGRLHPSAGTNSQDWLAFDAGREGAGMELLAPGVLHITSAGFHAVLLLDGICLAPAGNGWQAALPAGVTYGTIGLAWGSAEAAKRQAGLALSRLAAANGAAGVRRQLRAEWDDIYARLRLAPTAPARITDYARRAVWTLLTNSTPPLGHITRPAIYAAKTQYPGIYPWDSAFAALALKEAAPELAKEQIRVYTDLCEADGRIGVTGMTRRNGGVQYPLLTWAAWRIFQATGDTEFLAEIHDPLTRHADWWITAAEASQDGIPAYKTSMCVDDSPRFDPFAGEGRMSLREPVFSPDLIYFCWLDRCRLAAIATVLGRRQEAARHSAEAERLQRFANERLYDAGMQRYVDRTAGKIGIIDSPFNHFPAVMAQDPRARRHAAQQLGPGGPFWARYGVTSIATDEPCYDPFRGFRGAVWHAVNYLSAEACEAMGDRRTANSIARSSYDMMLADAEFAKGFRENYNGVSGRGTGSHHFPTLSAGPFLSLALGHHRAETPAGKAS